MWVNSLLFLTADAINNCHSELYEIYEKKQENHSCSNISYNSVLMTMIVM